MNKLVYNGVDLRDYGLYVSGDKTFNSPIKEYTKVSVPGRSGDLFYWDGKYSNVTLEYDCIIIPTPPGQNDNRTEEQRYSDNVAAIRYTLLSPDNYVKITDDYHPDEFRMGVFEGPLDISTGMLKAGTASLQFNCQPERWLVSGEQDVSVTLNWVSNIVNVPIDNPTSCDAYPLFKMQVTGGAKLEISVVKRVGSLYYNTTYGDTIELDLPIAGIYWIDIKDMDCSRYSYDSSTGIYTKSASANTCMTVGEFPYFPSGQSGLKIKKTAGTLSSFSYAPRWYRL